MNFHTLKETPIAVLADVFHRAFQGYFVPLEMTEEKLQHKIQAERIDLDLSVGAFDGDELVGFILHAKDMINGELTAYNAGTGVLPEYRGKQLTRKMYEYITPKLKDARVTNVLLEVIQQNAGAIKSYEQSGFSIVRHLPCYRGMVKKGKGAYAAEEIGYNDTLGLQQYFDWQPTWQNATSTIQNGGNTRTLGVKENGTLIAALTYTPGSQRLHQLVVHPTMRRKGLGGALLAAMAEGVTTPVLAINIDGGHQPSNDFLQAAGLEPYIPQYEMRMKL